MPWLKITGIDSLPALEAGNMNRGVGRTRDPLKVRGECPFSPRPAPRGSQVPWAYGCVTPTPASIITRLLRCMSGSTLPPLLLDSLGIGLRAHPHLVQFHLDILLPTCKGFFPSNVTGTGFVSQGMHMTFGDSPLNS